MKRSRQNIFNPGTEWEWNTTCQNLGGSPKRILQHSEPILAKMERSQINNLIQYTLRLWKNKIKPYPKAVAKKK